MEDSEKDTFTMNFHSFIFYIKLLSHVNIFHIEKKK